MELHEPAGALGSAEALKTKTSLRTLICQNNIGDEEVLALAEVLETNTSLCQL